MIDIGYKTLENIDKLDTLNKWLFDIIEPYVGQYILEVGCGIGTFTKFLIKRQFVIALDVSRKYIEFINEKFKRNSNLITLCCDIQDRTIKEVKVHNIDTIICFNVLEHIEDDILALENMNSILEEDGRLIILVPAIKFLFGRLDINLRHYRRYNFKELKLKLAKTGFSIEYWHYLHFLGGFVWFLNSRVLKRNQLPLNQIKVYDKLIPLIGFLEKLNFLPMGQSLLLICKK